MANVPFIFSASPGQGGNKNNGYTPSAAASGGYVPSAAASSGGGGYVPSAAASSGGGGYVPSAAASSGGGYVPSAAASSVGGGYVPSATASVGYVPSAAAGGGSTYTPSAAATGGGSGGYVPSAAAGGSTATTAYSSYNSTPSTTSNPGGYTPSAAAMGTTTTTTTSSYTPSSAASSTYVPSAAAGGSGSTSYTSSQSNACGYTPSAAAMGNGYTPSSAGTTTASSYVPSAAASAPSAPATRAPGVPALPAPAYQQQQQQQQQQPKHNEPSMMMQTAQATPFVTNASPLRSSYQHGNGPTHGVMTQSHKPVKCHKIDYEIKGSEMQLVEIHLDPQETVIAEAGAMMYLEDDIDFKTKFGDGSEPKQGFFKKLMAGAGRLMTGESLFITHFTNQGQGGVTRRAAFAAPYPGTILPIDMMELQQLYPSGNPDKPTALICQKDAFLCAAKGTKLEMHLHKKIGSGLFGGEGFILQKIKGDGMAFCHAGGCVIKRELKQGEKLRVDTGCLVAYTSPGIDNNIEMAPGLKTMFFGGEGLFLATLTADSPQGGTVWLQSLPFSRLCDRVVAHAPSIGGNRKGEGSHITGGLGDLFDGDGFGGGLGF